MSKRLLPSKPLSGKRRVFRKHPSSLPPTAHWPHLGSSATPIFPCFLTYFVFLLPFALEQHPQCPLCSFREKWYVFSDRCTLHLFLRLTNPNSSGSGIIIEQVSPIPRLVAHGDGARGAPTAGQMAVQENASLHRVFENCQSPQKSRSQFQAAEFFTYAFSPPHLNLCPWTEEA